MLAIGWTIGFGLAAARFAIRLDRSAVVWFVFGAILGPIASVILWQSPPAWCRMCLMPARGMLRHCWWCGEPFHGPPARVAESALAATGPTISAEQGMRPTTASTPAAASSTSAPGLAPTSTIATSTIATSAPKPTATVPGQSDRVPVMDTPPRERGRRRTRDRSTQPGPDAPAARAGGPDAPAARAGGPEAPPAGRTAVAEQAPRPTILATAVFYSGTVRLELGSRYGFIVDDGVLRIVGPLSPSVVAYERPLAGVTTTVAHGRLLLAVPDNRAGEFLVFTSVVGLSIDAMAETIQRAAQAAERA